MNFFHFDGRVGNAPVLTGTGDRAVAKFTLIQNKYAGKGENGEKREKVVAIQFTAFRGLAESIVKHAHKGDQLILTASVENNNWTDKEDVEHYGFSFIVNDFDFGAPGAEKRALLDQRRNEAA